MSLNVKEFFDKVTNTLTYIVYDVVSKDAIIIDPVLDYDQASSKVSFVSIGKLESFIKDNNLTPLASLETHAHADHLSAGFELRKRFPNLKIGVSEKISRVQELFAPVFNCNIESNTFDLYLKDDESITFGNLKFKIIQTPGHTPACASFLIDNLVFTGDSLFMPDFGTGRCDFPAGSAVNLYHSVHTKLYSLPNETIVFTGHDYMPNDRDLKFQTTIGVSKSENIHIKENTDLKDFVEFRTSRDKKLSPPKLLLPSIQVNINAGKLPDAESNGKSYLKIPLG